MFFACWRPRFPPLPVASGVQKKNMKMFQTAALFYAQLSCGGTVSEDLDSHCKTEEAEVREAHHLFIHLDFSFKNVFKRILS